MLRQVVAHAVQRLNADRGTLYLVDHARHELVSRVANLFEISEIRLRIGEGIAGTVADTGEAIIVRETDHDPRVARRFDSLTGYGTKNILCVPVSGSEGVIVAVLQLLNKHNGDFDEADKSVLHNIGVRVADVLDASSLRSQLRADHAQPLAFRFNHIVGESAAMQIVYDRLQRAASTDATVLLRGESGTGKSIVARAVHFNSARSARPLISVDCAALPGGLIENELFGHAKGAYTGADTTAEGKVQAADGGTLFLDEVGDIPLPVQSKLLTLLQDKTFFRVGSNVPEHSDVRFVVATNKDLVGEVKAGNFREDLYWRLRVVEIELPPLRKRGTIDIDRLIDHFLYEFSRRHGRPPLTMSHAARTGLHAHSWPGNVRELEHTIESAVVLSTSSTIELDALRIDNPPPLVRRLSRVPTTGFVVSQVKSLREVEKAYIQWVVDRCGGHRTNAASLLGIGRNTLNRKLKDDG